MGYQNDYEEVGEALGHVFLKYKYPKLALFCFSVTPIIIIVGIKFLLI